MNLFVATGLSFVGLFLLFLLSVLVVSIYRLLEENSNRVHQPIPRESFETIVV